MAETKPIYYGRGETEVHLGDYVRIRKFIFWKYDGRVVYIPGVSPKHPELEHHGLTWVGVRLAEGGFAGIVVDPNTNHLCHSPLFLRRGKIDNDELKPNECLFEDHEGIDEDNDDCLATISLIEEKKAKNEALKQQGCREQK